MDQPRAPRGPITQTATASSPRSARPSVQALAAEQLPISVDTKEQELVGNYKNAGRELAPSGEPILVNTHDFPDTELGKAILCGIYDVGRDEGWVSVGISAVTASFAVAAFRIWWKSLGAKRYPKAKATTLTITAILRRPQQLPHPPLEGRAAALRREDRP